MFEQNEMFDLRRELCRSNVFWAENGDGLTKYLMESLQNKTNLEEHFQWGLRLEVLYSWRLINS